MSGVRAMFVTTRPLCTIEDLHVVPSVGSQIEIGGIRYRIASHVWQIDHSAALNRFDDGDALDRYDSLRRLSVAIYVVEVFADAPTEDTHE